MFSGVFAAGRRSFVPFQFDRLCDSPLSTEHDKLMQRSYDMEAIFSPSKPFFQNEAEARTSSALFLLLFQSLDETTLNPDSLAKNLPFTPREQ